MQRFCIEGGSLTQGFVPRGKILTILLESQIDCSLLHWLSLCSSQTKKILIMKHHFSLKFRINGTTGIDIERVSTNLGGSDFQIEADELKGTEFSVHFSRDGDHAADLLEYARDQVIKAVPSAQLIEMDMSEEPSMMSVVDDITKVVISACHVFGNAEVAHSWLNRPQASLDGAIPKALMVNFEGRLRVARALKGLERSELSA